jgi:oligopeptide transport system substrate-binding protein
MAWAIILLGSGCTRHQPAGAAATVRISQRNEPADLDPALAQLPDDFFVIRALGEGLLVPDPAGGAPLPGLAAAWEVSPDQLEYTFRLRPGLRWSNGEPLTAADVVDSFRRTLEPATAAPKASLFAAVKNARAYATGVLTDFSAVGLRAPDATTVVVTLARPAAKFPWYVASGAWIPVNPRVVQKYGRTWTTPEHHVGCGPFVLVEWRPQQRIVVRRNPLYHAADRVAAARLEFIRFDNDDTEERAFRAGQVDVTVSVPKTKLEPYAANQAGELHESRLAETRFLSFNTRRPGLDDARVRRALSLALDRRKLIERVLLGHQAPADRFLSPALRDGAVPSAARAPRHDPATARALLAAAGFGGGRGFPRWELSAWSPSQVPLLEAIQAMWRQELGIEVSVSVREAKVHLQALQENAYDIAFVTTLLDVADAVDVLHAFTTGAPNNFPAWRSPAYDELLAAAARQPAVNARWTTLVDAESLLLEAAPVAPLYYNVQNWLLSPRVRGWRQDPLWNRSYVDLSVDEP